MGKTWKKGRGKLGFLQPLLGRWTAEAKSEMGPVRCTRSALTRISGWRCRRSAMAVWYATLRSFASRWGSMEENSNTAG